MPAADAISFATVRELGRKLRTGKTTAVALAEHFLDRLERLGPRLNAVVTTTRELALEQAAAADRELKSGKDRGPLHGIPWGAKDLLAVPGHPTTWGAEPYRKQVLKEEATVVRRLREAGAVLVAKLAMVELAGGLGYDHADAAFTGPGLNPWNPQSWSGGSSSGSAAAVAAGLVPLAIGTETCGSIVTPAAYCGVTGLRPTYGRVSRYGGMTLCWTLDKLGPLARTADDCALALAAIAGGDPHDPTVEDRPFAYAAKETDAAAVPPFKLAVVRNAATSAQPEVRAAYERSLAVLRKHAEITEIELPQLPYGAVIGTIVDCEAAEAFEELVANGQIHTLAAERDRLGLQAELFIPARDYLRAQRIRRVIQRELTALLAPFDALVSPARSTVAPPIDRSFSSYGTWNGPPIATAENAAGLPGLTLPNGFGDRKLPTGLHLTGRAWDETKLIAIGRYLQSKTDWHTKHPDV